MAPVQSGLAYFLYLPILSIAHDVPPQGHPTLHLASRVFYGLKHGLRRGRIFVVRDDLSATA
jgi:hypothetical protein